MSVRNFWWSYSITWDYYLYSKATKQQLTAGRNREVTNLLSVCGSMLLFLLSVGERKWVLFEGLF